MRTHSNRPNPTPRWHRAVPREAASVNPDRPEVRFGLAPKKEAHETNVADLLGALGLPAPTEDDLLRAARGQGAIRYRRLFATVGDAPINYGGRALIANTHTFIRPSRSVEGEFARCHGFRNPDGTWDMTLWEQGAELGEADTPIPEDL